MHIYNDFHDSPVVDLVKRLSNHAQLLGGAQNFNFVLTATADHTTWQRGGAATGLHLRCQNMRLFPSHLKIRLQPWAEPYWGIVLLWEAPSTRRLI